MAHILFIDERGQDHRKTPYEVLAGVAIEDRNIWNCILEMYEIEIKYFGTRISNGYLELKGKIFLIRKVFRHAARLGMMDNSERTRLAFNCLQKGKDNISPIAQIHDPLKISF